MRAGLKLLAQTFGVALLAVLFSAAVIVVCAGVAQMLGVEIDWSGDPPPTCAVPGGPVPVPFECGP